MKKLRFYFINYKNSIAGVGGVGTVSRDLVKHYPDIKCVFWDGTGATRTSDMSISAASSANHDKIHLVFFKKYLWSALHGIEYSISDKQLNDARQELRKQTSAIAGEIIRKLDSERIGLSNEVFWVNDYTAVSLVRELRDRRKRATIVFSFRTPFGRDGVCPGIQKSDVEMFVSLLKADLVTFHRRCDMLTYLKFLNEEAIGSVKKIKTVTNMKTLVLSSDGHVAELLVVPMGNNLQYRQGLASTNEAHAVVKEMRSKHRRKRIITSISRFEHTKGVEYEIDLIDALMRQYPEVRGKFVFLRYTYRSKKKVDDYEYSALHDKVVGRAEDVNRKYGNKIWTPIIYSNNSKLTDQEVTAVLQASDILVIASVADGFNHLALEAIYSQTQKSPRIQLLLSNIGVTDYIRGYRPLRLNIEDDVKTLYQAIMRPEEEVDASYDELRDSAAELSSEAWIETIVTTVQKISESKEGKVE